MHRSIPSWPFGPLCLALALGACHEDSNVLSGPIDPIPTTLAIVSGNHQEGMAGRYLAPLVVQVRDANGKGVAAIELTWTVSPGAGVLCPDTLGGCQTETLQTHTTDEGRAEVRLRPTRLGVITVTASVPGQKSGSVTFSVSTHGITILVLPLYDCYDPRRRFVGPEGEVPVTVPIGVPVEWEHACGGRITGVGPGGVTFDSGWLLPGQRFTLVPTVAGRWSYYEFPSLAGHGTATLIISAQEPGPGSTPTGLTILAGDHQEGIVGRPMDEAFVVRVSDISGKGLPGSLVSWRTSAGIGAFCLAVEPNPWPPVCEPNALEMLTDGNGQAEVRFRPGELGLGSVSATVAGGAGPALFTTNTIGIAVYVTPFMDCVDQFRYFAGPDGQSLVTITLGASVEWQLPCGGRIGSTSGPDGAQFNSGSNLLFRFRLTPPVTGTWEYRDLDNEGSGTLRVIPDQSGGASRAP